MKLATNLAWIEKKVKGKKDGEKGKNWLMEMHFSLRLK